ncbi:Allantoicase [Agyrium rufum]|nr:Allantoicase [Agyrium rufum]
MEVQSSTSALIPASTLPPSDAIPAAEIDRTFADCIGTRILPVTPGFPITLPHEGPLTCPTDLISSSLHSKHISHSDEFFASASNLTNPLPPIRRPGVYVETGAWYDGWETRRHNRSEYDYVIIRLGVASGIVQGVEVDTAFFDGNHAPEISVQGCLMTGTSEEEKKRDGELVRGEGFQGWEEVLGKRECGASRRQAWSVMDGKKRVSHVRLCMYPDGGIARFRLFGHAVPVWPEDKSQEVELSAATMGGVAVSCSDQHFGRMSNLILPGRGKDMGDGWETRRSRGDEHTDWAIIRLGARGKVSRVVVDTAHFRGNFPRAVKVLGIDAEGQDHVGVGDNGWKELTEGQIETRADMEKEVSLKSPVICTHIQLVMIPDGGVKRIRAFGTRI